MCGKAHVAALVRSRPLDCGLLEARGSQPNHRSELVQVRTEAKLEKRRVRPNVRQHSTGAPHDVRGQALVILLLMTSIAAMILVYGSSSEAARSVKAERKTRATLE